MSWHDLGLLDEIGFSIYEKKALTSIVSLGVADAASLCREGDIPTSKIYAAMEKLAAIGVVEIQPSRPKLYAARPTEVIVERIADVARLRADRFVARTDEIGDALAKVKGSVAGHETFADLALGVESHVKRHLVRLATAQTRILSYLEEGDLNAIDRLHADGFPVLRRIARNVRERGVEHRVIFGFRYASGRRLTSFLARHGGTLSDASGLRYSGELGHPFHVVDDDIAILAQDHPFIPDGRFASLLIRDQQLVEKLTSGFETLWGKAMRDLREVRFHPQR